MKRIELLDIVRANKEKHIADFAEAQEDYKALVLKNATANLKIAKTGDLVAFKNLKGAVAAPTSYEDSYQRAIRMLELSVEDVIEIEEDVFNQLVLDEWRWKQSFTVGNTMYKSGIGG